MSLYLTLARRSALALACSAALLACSKSESHSSALEVAIPPAPPGVKQTKVVVDEKGFSPSKVELTKAEPASLVFVRTSDATCATEVVFPELKLEKELPLNTPVRIDIPTTEARTLTFQCGMGMYKSAVLIQ